MIHLLAHPALPREGSTMGTPAITDDAAGITEAGQRHTNGVVELLLAAPDQRVEQVPVDALHEHPDNPRGQVRDVDDLADSIRANGILEPLIVAGAAAWQRVDDRLPFLTADDYVIIAGHRRKAAAVQAGATTVPCLVRDDLVGVDAEVAMLVENLQREDIDPLQEARGFQRLEDQGKSQREIARLVGRNQSHVSKRLALLKLPDEIQEQVRSNELPLAEAVDAAKYADDPHVLNAVLRRASWEKPDTVAARVTEQRNKADELAAERKKWQDRGVQKIVEYRSYNLGPHQTPRALEHLESDGVDVSDHEHWACHAMALGHDTSGNIRAVAVCTNPKVHPESRENKQSAAEQKAKAREERDQAAREKRSTGRLAIVTQLAGAKKLPDAAVDLAERYLLDDLLDQVYDAPDLLTLIDVLQLPPVAEDDDGPKIDARTRIDAYLNSAPGNTRRTLLAAVLVQLETVAESGGWMGTSPLRARYLTLLEAHGHKLSGPEIKAAKGEAVSA